MQKHLFGGHWTKEKLERVQKYLRAYVQALKRQGFAKWYIDAFAGTGYRHAQGKSGNAQLVIACDDELDDVEAFQEGSVIHALKVEPPFDQYLLIEQHKGRAQSLQRMKTTFPGLADRIRIENAECNGVLQRLAAENWANRRAVVFMDPYGMQVAWKTLEALASTQAVDLWLLFPHAYGVNRMLKRDGHLDEEWRNRLTQFFGTEEWHEHFYAKIKEFDIEYGESERIEKIANLDVIRDFYLNRLRSIFVGVAENPLTLYNSNGTPLYLLCFACANERGKQTALRIAQDILKKN